MRVLQIEDDEATAKTVALTLRAKGFDCDTASFGEEAVALATSNSYDLILLDIMLPDIDGYEVLRRLRAAQIETPVVIQSALIGRNDMETGSGFGVRDYLVKPFNRHEFTERIEAALHDLAYRRRAPRRKTLKSAQIVSLRRSGSVACLILNVSVGGAALQLLQPAEVPDTFSLSLETGETHRCQVRWRQGTKLGVKFEED